MVRQPSMDSHKVVKTAINRELVCKIVKEQETKRSELVQEIESFEFTDIYSCQETICKIEDAKKVTCRKQRKLSTISKMDWNSTTLLNVQRYSWLSRDFISFFIRSYTLSV
jgi:hypothetical protein